VRITSHEDPVGRIPPTFAVPSLEALSGFDRQARSVMVAQPDLKNYFCCIMVISSGILTITCPMHIDYNGFGSIFS
jgi:hypothetical protein